MMPFGANPPYECRRCVHMPQFSSYNMLRAHLRAVHRVPQLSNDDLSLYEVYPGSRFEHPPFGGAPATGAVGGSDIDHSNVDQTIHLRDQLVQSVVESVNIRLRNQPPPTVNFNNSEIIAAIQNMTANQPAPVTIVKNDDILQAFEELRNTILRENAANFKTLMKATIETIATMSERQPRVSTENSFNQFENKILIKLSLFRSISPMRMSIVLPSATMI